MGVALVYTLTGGARLLPASRSKRTTLGDGADADDAADFSWAEALGSCAALSLIITLRCLITTSANANYTIERTVSFEHRGEPPIDGAVRT
jgi:hypothetical protein